MTFMARKLTIGVVLFVIALTTPAWSQDTTRLKEERPGVGVDSEGKSAIDPTKNVNDLVQSLKESLRDLRTSDKELYDVKIRSASELAALQAHFDREIFKEKSDHLDDTAKLRAEFFEKINVTEKDR